MMFLLTLVATRTRRAHPGCAGASRTVVLVVATAESKIVMSSRVHPRHALLASHLGYRGVKVLCRKKVPSSKFLILTGKELV